MSMKHNLGLAKQAYDYVAKTVTGGAGNKAGSTQTQKNCVRRVRSEVSANNGMFCSLKRVACLDGVPWPQVIRNAANAAKTHKCGNCGEQTALGFMLLHERLVRPLDFIALRESDIQFHQFLVIGRTDGSTPRDITTWGPEAVVCDVWHGACYAASEMRVRMYGREQMSPKPLWHVDGWATAGVCPIEG